MEGSNQFLRTERIGKLMQKYAILCIISLLVGALYKHGLLYLPVGNGQSGGIYSPFDAAVGYSDLPDCGLSDCQDLSQLGGKPYLTEKRRNLQTARTVNIS